MRHIYVGMTRKTWCKAVVHKKDGTLRNPEVVPVTEGEFIDGDSFNNICPDCAQKCSAIRGEPNHV